MDSVDRSRPSPALQPAPWAAGSPGPEFPSSDPSRYTPFAGGVYEVVAGLRPLGTSFGQGPRDSHRFQFDRTFPHYRAVKVRSRSAALDRYAPPPVRLNPDLIAAVVGFIRDTLVQEHPAHFRAPEPGVLDCVLTGERLRFTAEGVLEGADSSAVPAYRDALDALASQVQEDLAIWQRDPGTGGEWLAAVHLCFPNHWAADEKVGRDFNAVHAPVADFGRLARAAPALVAGMVEKGPFVRFAWGVATDAELDHHPRLAPAGRAFDPLQPRLYARVERQTLTPFPDAGGALFTIRTYFLDAASDLSDRERRALAAAIASMSDAALEYKGLACSRAAVVSWLRALGS